MTVDRSFVELNHAATDRMRALAAHLTDEELQRPVGEHWTVAIVFAHLAFLFPHLQISNQKSAIFNPFPSTSTLIFAPACGFFSSK